MMSAAENHNNPQWLYGPLLRGVSRSFYLTLRVLPGSLRPPLSLAYLLARTSDTIADSLHDDPHQRLERLAGFKRAVAGETYGVKELPVVDLPNVWEGKLLQTIPALLAQLARQPAAARDLIRAVISEIVDGQSNDITHFECGNSQAHERSTAEPSSGTKVTALPAAAALNRYTFQVAGCVGDFWTRLCALNKPRSLRDGVEPLAAKGVRYGMGLQLVNILRDLPEDLANGRCYLPADELTLANCTPDTLQHDTEAASPVFKNWLQHARDHLVFADEYVKSLRGWRITFACRLPLALAHATLDQLGNSIPTVKIKVSRQQLRQLALREALKSF